QYGFWKAFVTLENPRALAPRHLAPIGLAGAVAGGGLLSVFLPFIRPLYAGLWAVYALACLAMALWEVRRAGWRYLPLLPPAFATIHLCWGAGFWWGFLRNGFPRLFGRPAPRRNIPVLGNEAPERAGISWKEG
ncbi:MAG: hypothetical protein H5T60_14240, partial [Anaerolineae bacterium]|nr:hypothetical protein [Anaerolineae bacterium]